MKGFEQFGKGAATVVPECGYNCVIYTRISSKDQSKYSLELQLAECTNHAERQGYQVLKFFGGTYESAKQDERKEFNRMLKYARSSKVGVHRIVVYNFDRFSRTGANAMYIASELKKSNIIIESVTQPTDSFSPTGDLQRNIFFSFSQYENQIRTQRMVAGRKASLEAGNWTCHAPYGYDSYWVNGERKLVVNEVGKKLRKAFHWKAKNGLQTTEIVKRLKDLGLTKMYPQKLSKIFKNPFYAGMIVHASLEGKVVKGKQEKLVSKEVFLKVNGILQDSPKAGKVHGKEFPHAPLKRFLRCSCCGEYLTSYSRTKKSKKLKTEDRTAVYTYAKPYHYYKCRTKGCKLNASTEPVHEAFISVLQHLELNRALIDVAKAKMEETFARLNADNRERLSEVEAELTEVNVKIKKARKALFMQTMDKEIYDEFMPELEAEKIKLEAEISKAEFTISNPQKYIAKSLEIASNLPELWISGDYSRRQRLQKLVFPDDLYFSRDSTIFRTPRLNSIFALFTTIDPENEGKKREDFPIEIEKSPSAEREGFEPSVPG